MSYEDVQKVWMNGRLVDFADAKIHAFSHVFHYGSAMFEGARLYKTRHGSAVFRIDEHIKRLYDSCKVYRMEVPYSTREFRDAIFETIRANGFEACYIRPVVYRGLGALGVNPFNSPVEVMIAVWKWGKYLGDEAIEGGVDVCVSSWNRMAPNTFPAMAKATGNYLNSALIKMEAIAEGYSEGIALDTAGNLSEGSGQNLFLVRSNTLYTPPLTASILPGITRDSVITLARDLGFTVREEMLPRELLYIADEAFFVGTAVEITPIRSVDKIQVGNGRRGPITEAIQQAFFDVVTGRVEDTHGWLEYVYEGEPRQAAVAAARTARA